MSRNPLGERIKIDDKGQDRSSEALIMEKNSEKSNADGKF